MFFVAYAEKHKPINMKGIPEHGVEKWILFKNIDTAGKKEKLFFSSTLLFACYCSFFSIKWSLKLLNKPGTNRNPNPTQVFNLLTIPWVFCCAFSCSLPFPKATCNWMFFLAQENYFLLLPCWLTDEAWLVFLLPLRSSCESRHAMSQWSWPLQQRWV